MVLTSGSDDLCGSTDVCYAWQGTLDLDSVRQSDYFFS